MGGNSPAALRRIARGGFSWLPDHSKPDELATGIGHLEKLHEEYGTEFTGEVVHDLFIRLDSSVEAASASFPRVLHEALGSENLPQRNLLGNAEDLIARIREYEASGVTALDLKPVYHSIDELLTMMHRFAKDVMPAVA